MFDCDTVGLGDISRNGEGRLAFVPRLVGELDIESMADYQRWGDVWAVRKGDES